MSDLRSQLERESQRLMLPSGAHARLLERRRRRERNRRVSALGVGLTLAAGLILLTFQGTRIVGDRPGPAATLPDRFYEEIAGTYTTELSRKDPGVSRFGLAGSYTMRLRPNGVLLVSVPPGFGLQGTSSILFRLSGNLFSTNAFANFDCRNTVGTYRWFIQGRRLIFTPADEPCEAREVFFSSRPWRIRTNG